MYHIDVLGYCTTLFKQKDTLLSLDILWLGQASRLPFQRSLYSIACLLSLPDASTRNAGGMSRVPLYGSNRELFYTEYL